MDIIVWFLGCFNSLWTSKAFNPQAILIRFPQLFGHSSWELLDRACLVCLPSSEPWKTGIKQNEDTLIWNIFSKRTHPAQNTLTQHSCSKVTSFFFKHSQSSPLSAWPWKGRYHWAWRIAWHHKTCWRSVVTSFTRCIPRERRSESLFTIFIWHFWFPGQMSQLWLKFPAHTLHQNSGWTKQNYPKRILLGGFNI